MTPLRGYLVWCHIVSWQNPNGRPEGEQKASKSPRMVYGSLNPNEETPVFTLIRHTTTARQHRRTQLARPLAAVGIIAGIVLAGAVAPANAAGRTVSYGDIYVTQAGTVLDNKDIHGRVIIRASNVTIKNSIVRGLDSGSKNALIDNMACSSNLQVMDTEVVAKVPNYNVNGVGGCNFTLTRVYIHGVVDNVRIAGSNVKIISSTLNGNLHWASDPNQSNGTHDDNVQIQKGSNISITGSTLAGSHNAAIMVTQDAGDIANLVVNGNTIGNGACSINVVQKSYGPLYGVAITGNTFSRTQKVSGCAIAINGPTQANTSGNRWSDGSALKANLW